MRMLGRSLSWTFTAWLASTTASPLFANDWYVDINDPNCPSGTGSATNPFCKIQKAIDSASDGDTIHVRAGTYLEDLIVAKDLVLIGESGASSTIVDGNKTGSVVTIDVGRVVTITGLTLTNGLAAAGGGVMILPGADATLDHCVVASNNCYLHIPYTVSHTTGEVHGAGIAADQATVTLIGTAIQGNEAKIEVEGDYSTVSAFGGGIWISQGVLHLREATLSANRATSKATGYAFASNMIARGAGLCSLQSSLDGDSTSLDANVAEAEWWTPYNGQGALAEAAGGWIVDGTVDWKQFDVHDNGMWVYKEWHRGMGGGLLVDGASARFERCTIHDNDAHQGGGVFATGNASITSTDSSVDDNWAYVAAGGIDAAATATLSMTGGSISGNEVHDGNSAALVVGANATAQLIGTRFEGNTSYGDHKSGETIGNGGALTLEDCLIVGSRTNTMLHGGVINSSGSLTMLRCVVLNGMASDGGGLYNTGIADLTDTAIIQNQGYRAGAGCYNAGTGTLTLHGCTVAGNTMSWSGGAVLSESTAVLKARHSIFSGNPTPTGSEIDGTLTSEGYNLLASKNRCTITGNETGNQYYVDPLFVDPATGDFTLQSTSPAIDAGDPAEAPAGADAAAHPRWLDGNLDRVRILDLGAFEFDHAQLTLTTEGKPGASLTLDLSATSGLFGLLAVGLKQGEVDWPPFGALFVDLSAPAWLLPVGTFPSTITGTIPADTPDGTTLVFQCLAVSLTGGAGNLSNVASVTVRQP